jgi:cyclohexanecarboxylate-CoA ligase
MRSGEPRDLWSWVEWRAERTPDLPLAFDEHDRRLSFGALRDRGERVAAGLLARGIRPGTRVAWILPTRLEAVLLTVALARLGCQQVPLIPAYGPREIGFILEQAKPEWVVLPGLWNGTDYRATIDDAASGGNASGASGDASIEATGLPHRAAPRLLDAAPDLPEADPAALPDFVTPTGDPIRWIFYTSGTTSVPKGALHSDATLLASAVGIEGPHGFTSEDRVSLVFPYAHIGGPQLLFSALRVGYALILSETFAPEVVISALSRHRVSLAGPGPVFWQAFIRAQRENPDTRIFPDLRALIGGGAAKPAHLHAEARKVLGVPIISGYGLSECPALAYNCYGDAEDVLATDGRAVEGAEIRIVCSGEREAAVGEEGEIRVRGSMLFRGYLDASLDGEAFDSEGYLRTGDLASLDAAGQLHVVGRVKDIIIRKGENISAKEVEDLLATHPAIADVAVIGLADLERGERCCAVVVRSNTNQSLVLADLSAYCREAGLMKQKQPEQLECVDALPRNSTGKVLKAELRARFGDSN